MRTLLTRRSAVIASVLLGSLLAAPAVSAAVIVDQGPNFTVIEYCEGNPAGSVTLRNETVLGQSAATFAVSNSIVSVNPVAGWTFSIKKAGGVNDPIEVQFKNGKQTASFRGKFVPGKTDVECPVVK
jgi:hypothetical protein